MYHILDIFLRMMLACICVTVCQRRCPDLSKHIGVRGQHRVSVFTFHFEIGSLVTHHCVGQAPESLEISPHSVSHPSVVALGLQLQATEYSAMWVVGFRTQVFTLVQQVL